MPCSNSLFQPPLATSSPPKSLIKQYDFAAQAAFRLAEKIAVVLKVRGVVHYYVLTQVEKRNLIVLTKRENE